MTAKNSAPDGQPDNNPLDGQPDNNPQEEQWSNLPQVLLPNDTRFISCETASLSQQPVTHLNDIDAISAGLVWVDPEAFTGPPEPAYVAPSNQDTNQLLAHTSAPSNPFSILQQDDITVESEKDTNNLNRKFRPHPYTKQTKQSVTRHSHLPFLRHHLNWQTPGMHSWYHLHPLG